jgi:hypothetical protein
MEIMEEKPSAFNRSCNNNEKWNFLKRIETIFTHNISDKIYLNQKIFSIILYKLLENYVYINYAKY